MHIKFLEDWQWNGQYSVFSSEKFLKAHSDEYGWIGGYVNGQLKFVLPYYINKVKKMGLTLFRLIKFTTYTIYIDDDMALTDEKDFLNETVNFLKKETRYDFIEPPTAISVFNTYPDNSYFAPFGTYQLDLTMTEDELFKNLHSKHRNVVRKAMKSNVDIKKGNDQINNAYINMVITKKRQGVSFLSKDAFKDFIDCLQNKVEIYVSYYEGVVQGCAIIPFSNYAGYYLWGGSIDRPFTGALNFMQWEIIKDLKQRGVKIYDFVGARIEPEKNSKLEGIQRFKKRFGPELKTGYTWKCPLKKTKYKLYRFFIHLQHIIKFKKWQGDVVDQEQEKK